MSAVESALDVLSRAATMVQEERPKANLHRKPSSAWRKERRRDPIQSEALDMSHHSRPSVIVSATPQNGNTNEDKVVKSMSTRVSTNMTSSRSSGFRTPGGASDPEIEAHFKRSLGPKKYAAVFNVTTNDKDTSPNNDSTSLSYTFFAQLTQLTITSRKRSARTGSRFKRRFERRSPHNHRTNLPGILS